MAGAREAALPLAECPLHSSPVPCSPAQWPGVWLHAGLDSEGRGEEDEDEDGEDEEAYARKQKAREEAKRAAMLKKVRSVHTPWVCSVVSITEHE